MDSTHRTKVSVGVDKVDSTHRTKVLKRQDKVDGTIPTHQPTHKNTHIYESSTHLSGIEKILLYLENEENTLLKKLKLNFYKKIAGEDKSKHKDNIEEHTDSIYLVKNYPQLFE